MGILDEELVPREGQLPLLLKRLSHNAFIWPVPSMMFVRESWVMDVQSVGMEKIPETNLGTVERCIYYNTARNKLTTEHIIPLGLNGPWKLLEASCETCAGITSGFERAVLKKTFGTVRTALDFPSSRKKDRPLELPLSIKRGGKTEIVYLPVKDYPAVIVMPHFEAPAYLDGRTDEHLRSTGFTGVQIGGPPIEDVGRRLSAQGIVLNSKFEPVGAFARLLAKIAYGCAVAAVGCDLSRFKDVYVLPAILGKSDDIGRWVGGMGNHQPPPESDLHFIKFYVDDGDLRVHVRLFAQYDVPEYVVVVWRIPQRALTELELPEGAYWI
jgi:hypothetical protein